MSSRHTPKVDALRSLPTCRVELKQQAPSEETLATPRISIHDTPVRYFNNVLAPSNTSGGSGVGADSAKALTTRGSKLKANFFTRDSPHDIEHVEGGSTKGRGGPFAGGASKHPTTTTSTGSVNRVDSSSRIRSTFSGGNSNNNSGSKIHGSAIKTSSNSNTNGNSNSNSNINKAIKRSYTDESPKPKTIDAIESLVFSTRYVTELLNRHEELLQPVLKQLPDFLITSVLPPLPRNWPCDVLYTSQLLWSAPGVADLRPRAYPRITHVRIRRINDHKHPANGSYGLFASVPIPKGMCIGEYTGHVRIKSESHSSNKYLFDYGTIDEIELDIDAEKAGNEFRFINDYHNIAMLPNVIFDELCFDGRRHIVVRAVTDILVGDEILIDYGSQYTWKDSALTLVLDLYQNDDIIETLQESRMSSKHRIRKIAKSLPITGRKGKRNAISECEDANKRPRSDAEQLAQIKDLLQSLHERIDNLECTVMNVYSHLSNS